MNQQGKTKKWLLCEEKQSSYNSRTGEKLPDRSDIWIKPIGPGYNALDRVCLMSGTISDENDIMFSAKLIAHAPDLLRLLKECSQALISATKYPSEIKMFTDEIDNVIKEIES
jgi:hypothetical protein